MFLFPPPIVLETAPPAAAAVVALDLRAALSRAREENPNLLAARAEETHGEVVNIACGEAVTVNAIIGMINQLLGKNVKPIYAPARAGDVKHSLADITAAKKLIGFKPVMLFREGLEKSIDWYRRNLS